MLPRRFPASSFPRREPGSWLRSLAIRLEPAADIHLRMRFAAIVPRALRIRSFLVPLENVELQIAAMDHDPASRTFALQSADLTPINRIDHPRPPKLIYNLTRSA